MSRAPCRRGGRSASPSQAAPLANERPLLARAALQMVTLLCMASAHTKPQTQGLLKPTAGTTVARFFLPHFPGTRRAPRSGRSASSHAAPLADKRALLAEFVL